MTSRPWYTSPVMPVASSTLHDEPLFRRMARLAERRLWRSGPIAELRKARYERRFEFGARQC